MVICILAPPHPTPKAFLQCGIFDGSGVPFDVAISELLIGCPLHQLPIIVEVDLHRLVANTKLAKG